MVSTYKFIFFAFMVFKLNSCNNVECHHVRTIKVTEIYCSHSNNVMTILLVGVAQCEFVAN